MKTSKPFPFVASRNGMRSIVLTLALLSVSASAWSEPPHSFVPPAGFVPDAQTAIAIAVAVWKPLYGPAQIEGERPYTATLKEGVWHVSGSLPKGWLGGVAEAEISRKDGRVIRVSHGK